FDVREGGGIEISFESRVAPYYGNSILEQARAALDELGVKHARVSIHDEGALPFVIAARIEAAVRRAGLALGKRSLPVQHPVPARAGRSGRRGAGESGLDPDAEGGGSAAGSRSGPDDRRTQRTKRDHPPDLDHADSGNSDGN